MSSTANEVGKKAKSEVETVLMQDGRKVDFVGKRKLLKESLFGNGQETPAVRLDYRNGETRVFEIPTDLFAQFACHGAEQKLGDETAGMEDVDDMVIAVDELIDRLNKGEWSTRREGSGFAGTSILLQALVEVSGKTIEQIRGFLSGKTQADKMALRNSPKIKPVVDKLEAAKATKVDTESLLGELDAM